MVFKTSASHNYVQIRGVAALNFESHTISLRHTTYSNKNKSGERSHVFIVHMHIALTPSQNFFPPKEMKIISCCAIKLNFSFLSSLRVRASTFNRQKYCSLPYLLTHYTVTLLSSEKCRKSLRCKQKTRRRDEKLNHRKIRKSSNRRCAPSWAIIRRLLCLFSFRGRLQCCCCEPKKSVHFSFLFSPLLLRCTLLFRVGHGWICVFCRCRRKIFRRLSLLL